MRLRSACLLVLSLLSSACGDDNGAPAPMCTMGSVGCTCYPNSTCDAELTCASNLCVDLGQSGAGGSGAAGSGGSGGTGGSGGASGSSGIGGAGSVDGGAGMNEDAGDVSMSCGIGGECSQPAERCRVATCVSQTCVITTRTVGYVLVDDVAGDCKAHQCGSNGDVIVIANTLDAPADPAETCLASTCVGPTPTLIPEALGLACGSGQVCDGNGACVACKADGVTCAAGAECCNGACLGNACDSCPVDTADCDGLANNGCETSLTTLDNCGACGNTCAALPHVELATCGDDCTITRCDAGFANADGVVANGCESPTTPYAPCTRATASQVCGGGEDCVAVGGDMLSARFDRCPSDATQCFCALECAFNGTSSDCPSRPSGTAVVDCDSSYCYLDCASNRTCPVGMTCKVVPPVTISKPFTHACVAS